MKKNFPIYIALGGLLLAGALTPSCKSDEKVCDTALQDSLQVREMRLREREMDLREREMVIMERERTLGITPGSPGSYSYRSENESGLRAEGSSGSRGAEGANSGRATGRNRLQGYGNDPRGVAYKKPVLAFPGQYPESSERVLNEKDMEHQTSWGKRVMLNEIYARHGYIFPDAELKRHFADESWYKGTEKSMAKLKLTALEKQNIAFIQSH
jgi:hypothetical protein